MAMEAINDYIHHHHINDVSKIEIEANLHIFDIGHVDTFSSNAIEVLENRIQDRIDHNHNN